MSTFNNAERQAALHVGATMLRERFPTSLKCHASFSLLSVKLTYTVFAAFGWPGVVRVTMRDTGQFIAQSLPGQPFELDPGVHA